MRSHWTILVLSKENRGVGKFKMSPLFVLVVSLIIAAITGFSVYAGYKLYVLRSDLARVDQIKEINRDQSRQIELLSEKVASLDGEMSILRSFNRHLSGIAKVDLNTPEEIIGVGGGGAESIGTGQSTEVLTEKILARKLHSHIKQLGDDISIEKDVARELLAQIERQRSLMAHTPAAWPTRGWITSHFGWRNSPFTGKKEFHKGVDIASRKGTPIYAPADGIVTSYYKNGGYGNFLVINHGYGIVTRYGHLLKSNDIQVGQRVRKGDKIAFLGNTGRSTGSHVHYEVLVNGIHVNPQRYMLK
ncbi:MAG TPA: M23 family metallopeptidase [Deltaproteobacteria bacterium]|nr:M23 family metallopeptidase [Deltaproteobacteria bacterium]